MRVRECAREEKGHQFLIIFRLKFYFVTITFLSSVTFLLSINTPESFYTEFSNEFRRLFTFEKYNVVSSKGDSSVG